MNLAIKQETLLSALQQVVGVVENNKTIPILSNILVAIKDNSMSITATDLGIEITSNATLTTAIDEEISFTLPGKKTLDICKALPADAEIELIPQKSKAILQYGPKCRFSLATLPAEDFPSTEASDSMVSFTAAQDQLKMLLQRTVFAMAHQDVRYYLNGMLLEFNPSQIRAVATDGHRLATNTIDVDIDTEHKMQCIIPRKAVMELIKLLSNNNTPVNIDISNNFICVTGDSFLFKSKLIEGRFPEYERVIPYQNDKVLELNRAELKNILTRAAIMCNDAFRGVTFDINNDSLRISSNNPDNEAAEQEIPIKYQQEPFSISFNVGYLLENLNVIETEHVELKLANQDQSMLITEVGSDADSIFVIMPMRI